jgi:hypothetical protein
MELPELIGVLQTARYTLDHGSTQLMGKVKVWPEKDYFLNVCADLNSCTGKLSTVIESLIDWNSRHNMPLS